MDTSGINLLALIGQDIQLTKMASTNGGEYAGPCPLCGGKDRFRVWPRPNKGNPRFWCRQCGFRGDAITYLRETKQLSFRAACGYLGLQLDDASPSTPRVQSPITKELRSYSPVSLQREWPAVCDPDWGKCAQRFLALSINALWNFDEQLLSPGRAYLRARGINDNTISTFYLGYHHATTHLQWGHTQVWLPSGIVFPYLHDGRLWSINLRRINGQEPKYVKAKGSANAVFVAGEIRPSTLVVLVEGEIDALSLYQETRGFNVAAVATGSSTGGYLPRWISMIACGRAVVLAFDADQAGEQAASRWKRAFPSAVRLLPTAHDVNAMHVAGQNIPIWLAQTGLLRRTGINVYR